MASANAQMKRMSFSADQALQAGLSQSKTQTGYVNGMDIAWRNATMFYQWLYRMESRHIMNNVVFGHDGLLPADDRYAALAKPLNEMSSLGDHFEYVFLMFFRSLHAHTHTHTHTTQQIQSTKFHASTSELERESLTGGPKRNRWTVSR